MRLSSIEARRLASEPDHGILGTIGDDGRPELVPACFAINGDVVAIPVDRVKAKASTRLQRERNLERDPRATLLVERWDAGDWTRLWWVRLQLERSQEAEDLVASLEASLRRRYRQYVDVSFASVLTFRITAASGWAASPPAS